MEAGIVTQTVLGHLETNLALLSSGSPDAVARIRATMARPDVQFVDTPDGVPTARLGIGAEQRLLASARRPLEEAQKLVAAIDLREAAVYVVAGFGMGHHIAVLARKLGRKGVVIVFEPDLGLLRAVLERVDCSAWMAASNVCILTDPDDGAAMGEALRGLEGLVGLGVTLVQHPPSGPRLGAGAQRFHERFTGVVEAVKMTVITTLAHARITIRNLMQNADVYATRGSIAELAGACAGRAGIVVSAGPSLQRNIELLTRPDVRERCVIVAVQTVLRQLLERGIRPHFVTALDYSEINRRFYEGLTAEQIAGVTLVVEPKVNPSVLEAWRNLGGNVLCAGDGTLDLLLGEKLTRDHGKLRQGATVAHLAYYLTRHLGCEPVALAGQDLGFTDGQYYASGASIHGIWACELNEFKSLELLEWHRIVRMGAHLRRTVDTLGREMFTDSQMHSYLQQFETDFRDDAMRGLTTIDATEGGASKQHTRAMTMRAFLDAYAGSGGETVEQMLRKRMGGGSGDDPARRANILRELRTRVVDVRGQVGRIGELSMRTAVMLAEMREHRGDRERVNRLVEKVQAHGAEVERLQPGFNLMQLLGQATVFNRVRADRLIGLEEGLSEQEMQWLQIERDIENVRGLEKTARELRGMLDGCLVMLDGGERVTRDLPKSERELAREVREARDGVKPGAPAELKKSIVSALVSVDLVRGGLGWARSLEGAQGAHRSVLAATVGRLLACGELRDVVLVGADDESIRALLDPGQIAGGRVRVEACAAAPDRARRRAIAAARLWARACWRGGLADLTVFDEVFDPRSCAAILECVGADAALLVGADWCAVDPGLCDEIIRRHREDPAQNRLAFTQAAPGLCGCVVTRELAADLGRGQGWERNPFASLGGMLGYIPQAPLNDLIAHPICVGLAGVVRDCGVRLIADTPRMREMIENATASEGGASLEKIVGRVVGALAGRGAAEMAEELVIARDGVDGGAVVSDFAAGAMGRTVTFGDGAWEPLESEKLFEWIESARAAGIAGVHVRTRLQGADDAALRRLVSGDVDVISVDCFDERDGLTNGRAAMERLLAARMGVLGHDGMGVPWVVARLVRCDATYGIVEEFVNEWMIRCGWAALDPLPEARAGERIAPLVVPEAAAARMTRARSIA